MGVTVDLRSRVLAPLEGESYPTPDPIAETVASALGINTTLYRVRARILAHAGGDALALATFYYKPTRAPVPVSWITIIDGDGNVRYARRVGGLVIDAAVDEQKGLVALQVSGSPERLEIYHYTDFTPLPLNMYVYASTLSALVNPSLAGIALVAIGVWTALPRRRLGPRGGRGPRHGRGRRG